MEDLEAGRITGCGPSVPQLTSVMVERTPRIVAQMGPEPLLDAIVANPDYDVLIAGRAYDLAPFVAFTAYNALRAQGLKKFTDLSAEMLGAMSHLGKILECGGLCATPKGLGAVGVMNGDGSFDVAPLDPAARCTPLSVAAHTLYEKSRPDILHGPGGFIDISNSTFTKLDDDRSVRVRGSKFHSARVEGSTYTVKLEGAKVSGFRTLTMGSFRDPILIPQIHSFLDRAKEYARTQHIDTNEQWDIGFHIYGFNENAPDFVPSEVFIVAEIIAESQATATSLASTIRVHCTHGSYPNQKATSGNFAMGIGGIFELETRECAEFSIYHLMPLSHGEEGGRDASTAQKLTGASEGLFKWKKSVIGSDSTHADGVPSSTNGNGWKSNSRPAEVPNQSVAVKSVPTALLSQANGINKPPTELIDIAKIVRSKNSGPYEVTLDVMFDDPEVYKAVKNSGMLDAEVIARLFNIDANKVIWAGFFDVAMAFKATIPRQRRGKPSCSGGYLENDVHGSQQYVRLTKLPLPMRLQDELAALV